MENTPPPPPPPSGELPPEQLITLFTKHQKSFASFRRATAKAIHTLSTNDADEALAHFISEDIRVLKIKERIRKWVRRADTVLIHGETGTGKELLARAFHGRRSGKFVAVNCAALPETLLESELFGHVKGAFTGADCDKPGLLETASGGTMFLDEIGDMPLSLQAKLLRALQERSCRRVGATYETTGLSCRFVCATHRNLLELVDAKMFREDLYYRISTVDILIPPLRERVNDVREIIDGSLDKEHLLTEEQIDAIMRKFHDEKFRGNVRRLQQLVERMKVEGEV